MRHWFKPALLFSLFFVPAVTGCLFAPTGTNKSATAYVAPTGKTVTLPYTPSSTSVAKVTFTLEESSSVTIPPDDSVDDGFNAVIDISTLTGGFYTVDVFEDDGTDPKAKLTLLVPGDGFASGTADTGASGTTATDGS